MRQVVVKSSTLVYGANSTDPAWFSEDAVRAGAAKTRVERSLIEVEELVRDFAEDNPSTVVSLLRFANVLGTDIVTPISTNLSRPFCPSIAGFDPLVQFVEEDDVVRALEHVTRRRIPGIYNVAGAGKLPWSEVAALCGTRLLPLPPVATDARCRSLGPHARLIEFPPELEPLLRFGRGVDTSRIAATGFEHRYTTAGSGRQLHKGGASETQSRTCARVVHLRARGRAVLQAITLDGTTRRQLIHGHRARSHCRPASWARFPSTSLVTLRSTMNATNGTKPASTIIASCRVTNCPRLARSTADAR